MHETRTLEFKEKITNTFLKTVSAFSNYNGGTILFGVDDDGNVKGLPDIKQACLDIENKINDSISPQPNYTLEIQNNNQTIKLTVKSGLQKPYLYKSKAYKRNDTATIFCCRSFLPDEEFWSLYLRNHRGIMNSMIRSGLLCSVHTKILQRLICC